MSDARERVELMNEKIIEAMRLSAPSYAQQGMSDGDWQQVLQAVIEAAVEEYDDPNKIRREDKLPIFDRILNAAWPVDPYE